jgi:hypothetical protein
VSRDTIARIWREYGVQPWRAETFKFSTDPQLTAKVHDVVGLYLTHPSGPWSSAWMRSPRSKPWNAPSPCAASGSGGPSGAATTTCDMAPRPCSPRCRCHRAHHQPVRSPPPPPRVPGLPQAGRQQLSTPPAAPRRLPQRHRSHCRHPSVLPELERALPALLLDQARRRNPCQTQPSNQLSNAALGASERERHQTADRTAVAAKQQPLLVQVVDDAGDRAGVVAEQVPKDHAAGLG